MANTQKRKYTISREKSIWAVEFDFQGKKTHFYCVNFDVQNQNSKYNFAVEVSFLKFQKFLQLSVIFAIK